MSASRGRPTGAVEPGHRRRRERRPRPARSPFPTTRRILQVRACCNVRGGAGRPDMDAFKISATDELRADRRYGCSETHASLLRRQRAQVGNDGVDVPVGHFSVVGVAHRRLEPGAVLAHALADGAPDVGVAPVAEALVLARRDIAGDRYAPRSLELASALADRILEIDARAGRSERRVAFQA